VYSEKKALALAKLTKVPIFSISTCTLGSTHGPSANQSAFTLQAGLGGNGGGGGGEGGGTGGGEGGGGALYEKQSVFDMTKRATTEPSLPAHGVFEPLYSSNQFEKQLDTVYLNALTQPDPVRLQNDVPLPWA
jgi:hypothetical protein